MAESKEIAEAKTNTFSKSLLTVIVFLYFAGALIGTVLVILAAIVNMRQDMPIDTAMFIAYAAYLGGPTATAIGFYAWKSKAENVLKIGKSFSDDKTIETMDVLSKMGGN